MTQNWQYDEWYNMARSTLSDCFMARASFLRGQTKEPPSVILNETGAELVLLDKPYQRIEWSQVREIAIITMSALEETFWILKGDSVELVVPDLIAGSDEFKTQLFAFPGFDTKAYDQARNAASSDREVAIVCWQARS